MLSTMDDQKPILIASSSFDEHTHAPVRERLLRGGYRVILYLTDRVLDGSDRLQIEISESGELKMSYEEQPLSPNAVAAAWYWKVGGFRIANAEHNVAKQLSLVNEMTQWNNTIWELYPVDLWLNAPSHIARAEMKLRQLLIAYEVGFKIPHTLATNDWGAIDHALLTPCGKIIVKMLRGVLADNNDLKVMYTTPLDRPAFEHLQNTTVPFPGLYQPFIEKAREWRVTVVGDDVFAAAIYTSKEAKDDWRRLQIRPAVQFRRERMPPEMEDICRAYLRRMELRYGAFDLIERPDGQIIFLECNPGGQHNWLEEELGLPIADAIASELIRIASR
jgi:hypothetical protein